MHTWIIWLAEVLLESALVLRALRWKSFSKYLAFYLYISFVLASDLVRFLVYRLRPDSYAFWWWTTELATVLLGYWLIMSIFEKVLNPYHGAKGFARNIGMAVFSGVVFFTLAQWAIERHSRFVVTSVEVERNLRVAEVMLLFVLLLVVSYYRVYISRNLKGIILGYGLYVGTLVIDNSARSFLGSQFQTVFASARVYSYLASLTVWIITLWRLSPSSESVRPNQLEADYHSLTLLTREAIGTMRSHLGKAGRL